MFDVLRITSKFFKGIITKAAVIGLKKSLGIDVCIDLEELEIQHEDGDRISLKLNARVEMNEEDFGKIVEKALK